MFKRIYNIELAIRNWNSTPAFYEDVLGFNIFDKTAEKGYREYKVGDGDTLFSLGLPIFYKHPNHLNKSIHITFLVDNLSSTIETLESRGVRTLGIVKDFGKVILTDIYDPEGYEFAVIQFKDKEEEERIYRTSSTNLLIQRLYNIEIIIKDWDNTPRWYEEVLGLRPSFISGATGYREYKVGEGYTLLALGSKSQIHDEDKNKNVFFSFEVANIHSAVKHLKDKGISNIGEVRNTAGRVMETNLYDPEGYQIALLRKNPFLNNNDGICKY